MGRDLAPEYRSPGQGDEEEEDDQHSVEADGERVASVVAAHPLHKESGDAEPNAVHRNTRPIQR